jgi:hypothetical protein
MGVIAVMEPTASKTVVAAKFDPGRNQLEYQVTFAVGDLRISLTGPAVALLEFVEHLRSRYSGKTVEPFELAALFDFLQQMAGVLQDTQEKSEHETRSVQLQ